MKIRFDSREKRNLLFYLLFILLIQDGTVVSLSFSGNSSKVTAIELNCCAVEQYPNFFWNNDTMSYDGLAYHFTKAIGDKFKCKSIENFSERNESFNSFVEKMDSCAKGHLTETTEPICKCDLGVGAWTRSPERYGKVQFLPPLVHGSLQVVYNIEDNSNKATFFLETFDVGVWLAILALFVFFTLLKLMDTKFEPDSDLVRYISSNMKKIQKCWIPNLKHTLLKSRVFRRLRKAVQSVGLRMISQSTDDSRIRGDSHNTRQWVLNFLISLCGLFLVLTYEATMTANLLHPVKDPFNSIHDFKMCHIKPSDVCITKGGATENYWKTMIEPSQKLRCNDAEVTGKAKWSNSHDDAVSKIINGSCKYLFADGSTAKNALNKGCRKLISVGKPTFHYGQGLIVPMGSKHFEKLSELALDPDIYEEVSTQEKFFKKSTDYCDWNPTSATLTFEKLKLFFILSYASCAIIFIEMIFDPQRTETVQGQNESTSEIESDTPITNNDPEISFDLGDDSIP